jgi:hypothetical protein
MQTLTQFLHVACANFLKLCAPLRMVFVNVHSTVAERVCAVFANPCRSVRLRPAPPLNTHCTRNTHKCMLHVHLSAQNAQHQQQLHMQTQFNLLMLFANLQDCLRTVRGCRN